MSKISVKFLIDKEQKRVIFAEAGGDFVDVLFSFLTLPLGRIARLLNKESGLGSLDSLYESVEQLDAKYLQTQACREMLLSPRSAAAEICQNLKLKNIHEPNPMESFICKDDNCLIKSKGYYTYAANCPCRLCGNLMDKVWRLLNESDAEGGVFVNNKINFMITDDLQVMPASLMNACSLLTEMQVNDTGILEGSEKEFGTEEALRLFQRSLVSRNVFSEICFPNDCVPRTEHLSLPIKEGNAVDEAEQEIALKLLINKKNNSVLGAEVGEDFINHLLSFLTFPLGSVLKFLPSTISLGGSVSNLHSSVETIGLEYFRSELCRDMLLTPKLPSFYGLKNQIIEIEETKPEDFKTSGCMKCDFDKVEFNLQCMHGIKQADAMEQNPKSTKKAMDLDRRFVAGPSAFMVADDLRISLSSFISAIGNGMRFPVSDLKIKEVCASTNKIRQLMGAMLMSKSALTDVFFLKSKRQRETLESKKSAKSKRQCKCQNDHA